MNLLAKPEGYANPQDVYMSPAQMKQVVKNQHSKQQETLLEMTMKSFLKERLYGGFHIFSKINNQNKNHLSARRDKSISKDLQGITQTNQTPQKGPLSHRNSLNFERRRQLSALSSPEAKQDQQYQKLNSLKRQQLSKIRKSVSQSYQQIGPIKSNRYSQVQNSQRRSNNPRNRSRIAINDSNMAHKSRLSSVMENYKEQRSQKDNFGQLTKGPSFISAVDFDEQSTFERSEQHLTVDLKLPKLNRNTLKRDDFVKNAKALFKKQLQPKALIDEEVWNNLLCKKVESKAKQLSTKNQSNLSQYDNYDELSTPLSKNLNKRQTSLENTKNPLEAQAKNSQSLLIKQNFMSLLKNQNLLIPRLAQSIVQFFEVPAKIQDKMRKYEIENIFTRMYNTSDRAWAVAFFIILDSNRDGRIDSSDIFKFNNYLDELLETVQRQEIKLKQEQSNRKTSGQLQVQVSKYLKVRRESKFKRQKTDASCTSRASNKLGNKTNLKKLALKQAQKQILKTGESEMSASEQRQIYQRHLISKNLQNLKRAKQLVKRLNDIILQDSSSQERQNRRRLSQFDEQTSQSRQNGLQQLELGYLQEALLQRQDLKISDLSLLLHEEEKSSSIHKKKVIQLDAVKLSIKLSSSYIQTFTATDHNEETRNNREYIETLKDFLKQKQRKRHEQNNDLERQSLRTLGYVDFFKGHLFVPFKELFYSLFHMHVLQDIK